MSEPTAPVAPPPPAYPAPAPAAPDTRPKTLGLTALILGIAGFVLSLVGFVPVAVVSMVVVIVGGLLLLAALALGIVALVSKKQGGKGLGIAALIVSVVGGIVWIIALVVSLLWIGLAATGTSVAEILEPSAVATAPAEDGTEATDDGAVAADEQGFVDAVRPEVLEIMQTIDPSLTEEQVDQIYTDEMLVSIGKTFAALPEGAREATREQFITQTVESSGGVFTEDTAAQFFDALMGAADTYLAG